MLKLDSPLGNATDPEIAERLHQLSHRGQVEFVTVGRADAARKRLHTRTDKGTELAIILDRSTSLANGMVLYLAADHAIVVRFDEPQWLALAPKDTAAALEIGYFCGNMHWKVRFVGEYLHVSMEGPREDYLQRIHHLVASGKVRVLDGN